MSRTRTAPRARRIALIALATAGLVGGALAVPSVSTAATHPRTASYVARGGDARGKIGHVWTIILENKSYEATFTGLNQNSYLWKTLPSYGELLTQYYGTGHFSLDNYISAVAGQAPAPDDQADCPTYQDVAPGYPAADGQVYASTGCVYPASVPTLFNQLQNAGKSWKVYNRDMGNDPARERVYQCGIPGSPANGGVPDPGGAEAQDQYVPKHNPAAWFRSLIQSYKLCSHVVPLDGKAATTGHPALTGIASDLKSVATTPQFSWISPNNCSDAHDATCKGDNLSGDPNNHQGGLYASDKFLEKYVPMIMRSPAFQKDGMIQVIFDEAFPPYKMYGNSIADFNYAGDAALGFDSVTGNPVQAEANTAQSVVACCNELPGPNTTQPGDNAFNQDTTPGGGITGAVFISRYITPGSVSTQPYNHYSWLRSMEDLYGITKGGSDGKGHLGYAGASGLRPFGPDIYNNISGQALRPAASGSVVYPASAINGRANAPRVVRAPQLAVR